MKGDVTIWGTSMRVLVVEDNPGDIDLVRAALEGDAGHWQIDHVGRLAEALADLRSQNADVILLDLSLPDASGLQAVTEITSAEPDVPLVVLTGTSDPEVGVNAVQQGAQDYLHKNELDPRVLGRILRFSIERQAAAQRLRLLMREQAARAAAEAAHGRAVLLADAGIAVASTLEEDQALARVASVLVPRLAACCAIERFDIHGHVQYFGMLETSPGASELRQFNLHTTDPLARAALRASCARGARIEAPAPEPGIGCDNDWREAMRGSGLQSGIVVPLHMRGEVLGTLILSSAARYASEDLLVAEEVARRIAGAIESARLYAQALEAVQIRDDFLSIASHEFRNPLSAIVLQATLLKQQEGTLPDTLSRGVERMVRSAHRLRELVEALLDASRLRAGRFSLDLSDVDLQPLVRDVVDRFMPMLAAAGSELRLQTDPSLRGRWDPSRIQQVIANLLQNAVRYGAGKPIEIRAEARGATVFLAVRDHGPGVDPLDQKRIFEQFARTSVRKKEGLGLGLWIAKEIVTAHGGIISVQSQPGNGAEFRVDLPCSGPPPASGDVMSEVGNESKEKG